MEILDLRIDNIEELYLRRKVYGRTYQQLVLSLALPPPFWRLCYLFFLLAVMLFLTEFLYVPVAILYVYSRKTPTYSFTHTYIHPEISRERERERESKVIYAA